MLRFCW